MSSCIKWKHHGISIDDIRDLYDNVGDRDEQKEKNESSESDSDSEAKDVVKYYHWKEVEERYLTKMTKIYVGIDLASNLWHLRQKY